jgi:uncharacterized oxidoreductase
MQLTNKTILITGGATGIGFALARALANRNNKVIITGRRLDRLKEAQKLVPALEYYQSDVSDPASIDALFIKLKHQGLCLDVVFNNAGVLEIWDILEQTIPTADLFTKISTNLSGPIAVTQAFIRQADHRKMNYIVNITTEAAIMPVPILPLYSSSKAGLSAFTKILRIQLKDRDFAVVEIVPPAVESKMTTEDMNNSTKLVLPEVFAQQVIAKIEAGKLEFAPSSNAWSLTMIRRFLPKTGLKMIDKISRKQILGSAV